MNLHDILAKHLKEWGCKLTAKPVETPTGLIAPANWQKQEVMIKIGSDLKEERTACVLTHYNGQGAVKLLKHTEHVSMMERATPGNHLKEFVPVNQDDKATHILCDTIYQLHKNKDFEGKFKTIADWGKGFDAYLASGNTHISEKLVHFAQSLYNSLIESQDTPILLHGDLHHDNIIYDKERGWLAIDPKGVVGEPAYEVGAFLRNPIDFPDTATSSRVISKRLTIIDERLGYDSQRVVGWAFSQAILAAIWSIQSGESPDWALNIAQKYEFLL